MFNIYNPIPEWCLMRWITETVQRIIKYMIQLRRRCDINHHLATHKQLGQHFIPNAHDRHIVEGVMSLAFFRLSIYITTTMPWHAKFHVLTGTRTVGNHATLLLQKQTKYCLLNSSILMQDSMSKTNLIVKCSICDIYHELNNHAINHGKLMEASCYHSNLYKIKRQVHCKYGHI